MTPDATLQGEFDIVIDQNFVRMGSARVSSRRVITTRASVRSSVDRCRNFGVRQHCEGFLDRPRPYAAPSGVFFHVRDLSLKVDCVPECGTLRARLLQGPGT